MVSEEKAVKIYAEFFDKLGEANFFTYMVDLGNSEIKSSDNADEVMLSLSKAFYSEYQKDNNIKYLQICKVVRRVAHIMYRAIRKNNSKKRGDERFLRSVDG